jgi:tRNA threonylcarbamoyladenosine biosynthesis protein TsaE
MSKKIELSDEEQTRKLGGAIWDLVCTYLSSSSSGLSIGFAGPLGAGKTTLIRSIGESAGITGEISSPTYVLQHEYRVSGIQIEHWDLYRVESCPEEVCFVPEKGIVRFIEWCAKFPEIWAEQDGAVIFDPLLEDNEKHLSLTLEGVLAAVS